jgi:ABC-2 type transport system ATP-binding protein
VTGFVGPNGAGKSTTLRMVMNLDRPTSGRVLIDGKTHSELHWPLREVGALLDASACTPGRSGRNHLRALGYSNGIGKSRVEEVLGMVGLLDVGDKRVRGYSLGMRQRLGIAGALLGDPSILLFDEPLNGLDPEGIHWLRGILLDMAHEGRTVLVSSHLMNEMAVVAEDLLVIGRGELLWAGGTREFISSHSEVAYTVRSGDNVALARWCRQAGGDVREEDGGLVVTGLSGELLGEVARSARVALSELSARRRSLEDIFMSVSAGHVEYREARGGGDGK